jgi:hypothetical protein
MKPGKFKINYKGSVAKVSSVKIGDKEGYKLEWQDYTLDWLYFDNAKNLWESETLMKPKMKAELGRMIEEHK